MCKYLYLGVCFGGGGVFAMGQKLPQMPPAAGEYLLNFCSEHSSRTATTRLMGFLTLVVSTWVCVYLVIGSFLGEK